MTGIWGEPKIRPKWLWQLSKQAVFTEHQSTQKPLNLFGIFTYPRNLLFLIIVLTHGFRRLLPPY